MSIQLNHTIVWCRDQQKSAGFLAQILGLPAPRRFMHFLVVDLSNGVSLDYYESAEHVALQHYAFLVSEEGFDASFARIRAQGLDYWADPARSKPGEINHHFGGRGVYFPDPDGHLLEIITRPYGYDDSKT
jgi:catechol 2,3-dioxygenase-like lactoylglutathione lyase family enzyme